MYSQSHETSFYFGEVRTTSDWKIWNKPKSCKFVHILAVGGGGGGSGGQCFSGAGAYLGSGGGGGGGGSCSIFLPAVFIPDTLYIQCGQGGLGGSGDYYNGSSTTTSATSGTTGGNTYVCSYPNTNVGNILALGTSGAGATTAGAYTDTNSSAVAKGGAGGLGASSTLYPFRALGIPAVKAGSNGSGGIKYTNSLQTQIIYMTGSMNSSNGASNGYATGGGGGGSSYGNGGNTQNQTKIYAPNSIEYIGYPHYFNPASFTPDIKGANGFNYALNYSNFNLFGYTSSFGQGVPFCFTGGAGGSYGTTNYTNNGGHGALGSGGGGGGTMTATSSAKQGGSGGDGGPGFVLIQCL